MANNFRKSRAKAAGVKSVFTLKKGSLVMTAFGRGNDAVIEKKVSGDKITSVHNPAAYSAEKKPKTFDIQGRMGTFARENDPVVSKKTAGDDLIHLRKNLELRYFGKNFEDNIHIQLIYSILDIDKILTIHVNNVIYELNNAMRDENAEHGDLFQSLSLSKKFESFEDKDGLFYKLIHSRALAYFGDVLYNPTIRKAKKTDNVTQEMVIAENKRCFYLLCVLGEARQSLAHCDGKIYQLETSKKQAITDAKAYLDALYSRAVEALNADFLNNAAKDLVILFSIYNIHDIDTKTEYARRYYDFVVRKGHKNLGFSIKQLRECFMQFSTAQVLSSHIYDTMRPRMYRTIDFIITEYYRENEAAVLELIEALRAVETEEQKNAIYAKEAEVLWAAIYKPVIEGLLPYMDGDKIKAMQPDPDVKPEMLKGILINTNVTFFSKFIYLLTRFQDGKEINDLLTTLIHAFENIATFRVSIGELAPAPEDKQQKKGVKKNVKKSFADLLNNVAPDCGLKPDYALFEKAGQIADELRVINSFARMTAIGKTEISTSKFAFTEAAKILGYPLSDDELSEVMDGMLSKTNHKKGDFNFRNFIANNVLDSARFNYLVRYANVEKVRALASKKEVIAFVLKDIPDTQIARYYAACVQGRDNGDNVNEDASMMRKALTKIITDLKFENFKNVRMRVDDDIAAKKDKIKKQAAVRLFLTVLYLLVKNMVYINSRYFLAFHMLERDATILNLYKFNQDAAKEDYTEFVRAYLDKYPYRSERVGGYIQQNLDNTDKFMLWEFRNSVDHLGAVRNMGAYIGDIADCNSYFELYHYIQQRYLIGQFDYNCDRPSTKHPGEKIISKSTINPAMLRYMAAVKQHSSYCMDMVKALNVPFAYNLPRYKNLSIKQLFDRNHFLEEKQRGKNELLAAEETQE